MAGSAASTRDAITNPALKRTDFCVCMPKSAHCESPCAIPPATWLMPSPSKAMAGKIHCLYRTI
eukprot:46500-Ditylum_brightwellii.AAC.1